MNQPQQPWGQQPWGQQPGGQPWGQQPPASWGTPTGPPPTPGSTPLLVLGLVTAVLAFAGTVLPLNDYDGVGTYGLLLQNFGESSRFQATGLVPLAAAVLLAVGAVLQRARRAGLGLLLVGAGMVGLVGVQLLLQFGQSLVDDRDASLAVGGVLFLLAGCTAVATVVLGLVQVSRRR
ncbi:hypothetical protein SAMN03159343_1180 [Klenkia marina]|uniref:Uncharacterized protein n=1 Tax=Klenkia marina TaxID=1960309 RepID=A0A1G4XPI9_9ACTN|nr:hypothetical protein [Klenkia marina]SCX43149.1 hypothetical protein SAMN03159343_1180 [Klenkia marina]